MPHNAIFLSFCNTSLLSWDVTPCYNSGKVIDYSILAAIPFEILFLAKKGAKRGVHTDNFSALLCMFKFNLVFLVSVYTNKLWICYLSVTFKELRHVTSYYFYQLSWSFVIRVNLLHTKRHFVQCVSNLVKYIKYITCRNDNDLSSIDPTSWIALGV